MEGNFCPGAGKEKGTGTEECPIARSWLREAVLEALTSKNALRTNFYFDKRIWLRVVLQN